jgi:predicted metal-dependent hydrolase
MTDLPVEIVRSARRKSTLQASIIGGTIRVRVPAGLPPAEERRMVDELVAKVRKKARAGSVDLTARAATLARRFDLPRPAEIAWSSRQNTRWGSCTSADGTIRISDRLASVPPFVLDYVIVHELAHLVVNGHGPEFDALVNRYELAERARGYLMALNQAGVS